MTAVSLALGAGASTLFSLLAAFYLCTKNSRKLLAFIAVRLDAKASGLARRADQLSRGRRVICPKCLPEAWHEYLVAMRADVGNM